MISSTGTNNLLRNVKRFLNAERVMILYVYPISETTVCQGAERDTVRGHARLDCRGGPS